MRRQTFTVSAVSGVNTHSPPFVADIHQAPFNISIGVNVTTSAKFTIQHTFDDIINTSADQCTWYAHEFIVQSSANIDGNYAFPITGARLEVSGNSDHGATVTFIQAGYPNG